MLKFVSFLARTTQQLHNNYMHTDAHSLTHIHTRMVYSLQGIRRNSSENTHKNNKSINSFIPKAGGGGVGGGCSDTVAASHSGSEKLCSEIELISG